MASIEENQQRYYDAAHAMQSGVALEITKSFNGNDMSASSPKHLRTGINAAMVEHSALVQILVEKGVITWDEFWAKLADCMETEVRKYERRNGVTFK